MVPLFVPHPTVNATSALSPWWPDAGQVLIKTDVTKYLEFKAVDGSFVLNGPRIEKVPITAMEAFRSPLMGLFEKRRAAKFFRSADVPCHACAHAPAVLHIRPRRVHRIVAERGCCSRQANTTSATRRAYCYMLREAPWAIAMVLRCVNKPVAAHGCHCFLSCAQLRSVV